MATSVLGAVLEVEAELLEIEANLDDAIAALRAAKSRARGDDAKGDPRRAVPERDYYRNLPPWAVGIFPDQSG